MNRRYFIHLTFFGWMIICWRFGYGIFSPSNIMIDSGTPLTMLTIDSIYTMVDVIWPNIVIKFKYLVKNKQWFIKYIKDIKYIKNVLSQQQIFNIDQDHYGQRIIFYIILLLIKFWLVIFNWNYEYIFGMIAIFCTLPNIQQSIRSFKIYKKLEIKIYRFAHRQYLKILSTILSNILDYIFSAYIGVESKVSQQESLKIIGRISENGFLTILKNAGISFLLHKIQISGYSKLHNLITRFYPLNLEDPQFLDETTDKDQIKSRLKKMVYDRDFELFFDPYNLKEMTQIYLESNCRITFDQFWTDSVNISKRFCSIWSCSIFNYPIMVLIIGTILFPSNLKTTSKYLHVLGILMGFGWILCNEKESYFNAALLMEAVPMLNSNPIQIILKYLYKKLIKIKIVLVSNIVIFVIGLIWTLILYCVESIPLINGMFLLGFIGSYICKDSVMFNDKMIIRCWWKRLKVWPFFSASTGRIWTILYLISLGGISNSNFLFNHGLSLYILQTIIAIIWLYLTLPDNQFIDGDKFISEYPKQIEDKYDPVIELFKNGSKELGQNKLTKKKYPKLRLGTRKRKIISKSDSLTNIKLTYLEIKNYSPNYTK